MIGIITRLYCDEPGCGNRVDIFRIDKPASRTLVRDEALMLGWRIDSKAELCPRHKEA